MLLEVENLHAGHGDVSVLHNMSFSLDESQGLAVLGRNGAGKTTLLETLMGLTTQRQGNIRLEGRLINNLSSVKRAALGLGWVPQEREVFPSLTVQENLTVVQRPGPWNPAKIYALFPRLKERMKNLGGQLSGGEQQMLAIGRALMTNPKILLLDEPMEGLAPIIVEELATAIGTMLKQSKLAAIVVEQHPIVALSMTDNAVIIELGQIAHHAPSTELAQDEAALDRYIGIGESER